MIVFRSGAGHVLRRSVTTCLPAVVLLLSAASWSCSRSKVPSEPKCRQPRDHAPWIVHWQGRDSVLSAMGEGPILVRYVGCELEVIPACQAKRKERYLYVGQEPRRTAELLTDAQQLYRKLPVDAPGLDKERAGADVRLRATTAGAWRTDPHALRSEDLEGTCDEATHLVSGVVVGSYRLSAVQSTADSTGTPLSSEGDEAACEGASSLDAAPRTGCASAVRLELSPLSIADKSSARSEPWVTAERKGAWARVLTLTTIASLVSLTWGASKVYSARKTIDEHCTGKACDPEGIDATQSGRTGAYMVNGGLAGAGVSILALVLFTGGGRDAYTYEEARVRPGPVRHSVAGAGAALGMRRPDSAAVVAPMRFAPVIHPRGVMLGWEARF